MAQVQQTTLTAEQGQPRADSKDVERGEAAVPTVDTMNDGDDESELDIEHMPVANDPRKWSSFRKNLTLALVASASMMAGFAVSIQNPAVADMERDLHATSAQFSLSLSMFIIVQGLMPVMWAAASEIKGRKLVYVISLVLGAVGSIAAAVSTTMPQVIGFRALQAAGLSCVMAVGAATLADIFEPAERGTKMGIYYIAPQLGPALGPMFGGALTSGLTWRAVFWFLAISSGVSSLAFLLFFKDTFRRERSLTYQSILKRRLREKEHARHEQEGISTTSTMTQAEADAQDRTATSEEKTRLSAEKGKDQVPNTPTGSHTQRAAEELKGIKLSIRDINPIGPQFHVLRRINNVVILFASALQFAFGYMLTYSSSRTLSSDYGYGALKIGSVVLAYGFGCMVGSICGGRWSDRELAARKAANGGKSYAEMRLKSTLLGVILLPPCVLAYGWVSRERVHVAAVVVFLFACGFFSIWQYSSTLAYIVDANVGRSGAAVSTNSAFRGLAAFIATEVAVPLQDGLGDGWMYTIWAVLLAISGGLVLLVSWKGKEWRENAERWEADAELRRMAKEEDRRKSDKS